MSFIFIYRYCIGCVITQPLIVLSWIIFNLFVFSLSFVVQEISNRRFQEAEGLKTLGTPAATAHMVEFVPHQFPGQKSVVRQ